MQEAQAIESKHTEDALPKWMAHSASLSDGVVWKLGYTLLTSGFWALSLSC